MKCRYIFSVFCGECMRFIAYGSEWRERLLILIIIKTLNWQIPYQVRNDVCLFVITSDSEFTSLWLNLVTVFSRHCFSFLSNVLSFFIAKKRKNIWCGGWGCINPKINKSALTKFTSFRGRSPKNLMQGRKKARFVRDISLSLNMTEWWRLCYGLLQNQRFFAMTY